MKLWHNRTALALALTGLAVLFPLAAWFLVGFRELSRQTREITENADDNAHETAQRIGIQLTERLNALRKAEALRPFYHYQPYFHDPQGASVGESVVPSPLGSGPRDPLVQMYFQVDAASGAVTLPTAEADLKQVEEVQSRRQRADDQLFLQRQLERGLNSIAVRVRGESIPKPQAQQKAATTSAGYGQRLEVLPQRVWAQNAEAADIYRSLKNTNDQTIAPRATVPTNDTGNVEVYVGPLKWRTVYVAAEPMLVALREVTTPEGAVFQGFLLSTTGLNNFFKTAGLPAKIRPGPVPDSFAATLAIGTEPWHVIVEPDAVLDSAFRQVADLRRSFWSIFLCGAGIAAAAGAAVVYIVWQTESLARQRSQFASSAAHELRTPLAGLRLYSDMLASGLGDQTKTQSYAQRIADEAERLGRVVGNMLGFTRLERGTLTVQPVAGDLADAIREGVARQHAALESNGATLELQITGDLPAVRFDRDAVAEILQNLLDNAEKHTRHAANRTIHVALAGRAGAVELSVCDHGAGLATEVRQHLFEAFRRGHEADAPAGLGLGLVLVKALAEAQGAKVRYEDANGGGARFVVTWPATTFPSP